MMMTRLPISVTAITHSTYLRSNLERLVFLSDRADLDGTSVSGAGGARYENKARYEEEEGEESHEDAQPHQQPTSLPADLTGPDSSGFDVRIPLPSTTWHSVKLADEHPHPGREAPRHEIC